jgi:site-specific recombinase XerD
MAKAPVVEEADFRRAITVAGVTGQSPARDAALLSVLYGTGLTATEVALLRVSDVLEATGEFLDQARVRAEIAFNGKERPIFWVNRRIRAALGAYFAARVCAGHGCTDDLAQWRGLDQSSSVFLTVDGRPFTLTRRRTSAGNTSSSCESLTQVIRKLHTQAGVQAAGSTSARRTFAVRLGRQGFDLRHIREVLGLASLSATKNLVEGDPVNLGRIVAKVL